MSNTIPPLLCSTPPPIDFDNVPESRSPENDDFEAFESADGVYGQFEGPSQIHTPQHSLNNAKHDLDLPIPNLAPFPTCLPTINTTTDAKPDDVKDDPGGVQIPLDDADSQLKETSTPTSTAGDKTQEQNFKSISTKESIDLIISEPPPIDVGYSSESQSPKNSRGDSPLSLEFSPGNMSDDDSVDFQIENESRYDDNTSLPSLKFDAINTISKSATPIPEDKSIASEKTHDNDEDDYDDEKTDVSKEDCSKTTSAFDTKEEAKTQAAEICLNATIVSSELMTDCGEGDDTILPAQQNSDEDYSDRPVDVESAGSSEIVESEKGAISETEAETVNDLNEKISECDTPAPLEIVSNDTDPDPVPDASNVFDEFTSFSWSDPPPLTSTTDKSDPQVNNGEFTFEADFSQASFAAFEEFPAPSIEANVPETSTLRTESKDTCDDDDFDEFDDFQDFAVATVATSESNNEKKVVSSEASVTAKSETCANDNEDDFGDFNDFQESSTSHQEPSCVATSCPVDPVKMEEKVKTVLDAMFPSDDGVSSTSTDTNITSHSPKLSDNELAVNLREIDTAKALDYQWLHSSIKNSLVKSLGIDSRNILYGEKWNTSMPRFAANLGCGTLEPLKPMKLGGAGDSMLMGPSKTHLSGELNKPSSSSSSSSSQVPAVKFDWNSSGLVNPLDASHAHTLLLDLDQLVVVANLDKIKLDSSPPCSSASMMMMMTTTTMSTTLMTPTTNTPITTTSSTNAQSSNVNVNIANTFPFNYNSCKSYTTSTKHLKTANLNDKYFDVLCLDYERNNTTTLMDDNGDGGGVGGGDDFNNDWINYLATSDNNHTSKFLLPDDIATRNVNCINATTNVNANSAHIGLVNKSYNDMFDQYLDCRVKEILHERKAETIHTTQPDDTDGSRIPTSSDKNSTKAEQTIRDHVPSLSSFDHDLNSLETTGQTTNETVAIETTAVIDEKFLYGEPYTEASQPTILPTPKLIPLKETHIFTPSKSENTISRSVNKTTNKGPIDFDYEIAAAGIVINEQVVKKEYRDVVYNLDAQSTSDCSDVMSGGDSISLDQDMPTVDPNKMSYRQTSTVTDLLSRPILNIMEKKSDQLQSKLSRDEFSEFQGIVSAPNPTTQGIPAILPRNEHKPPEEDDFTDFQSVPPPATSQQKSFISETPKSRTGTPGLGEEMILSPAVLLPQAIKIQPSEPKIHWPSDSEINPEELARLEQLFPQAKQSAQQQSVFTAGSSSSASASAVPASSSSSPKKEKDDDDWSDFVSVQPTMNSAEARLQQDRPIAPSSKLSTISKTYDDDDWSDFVSGTPSSGSNMGSGTATKLSWNNSMQLPPPQFSSWNQSPATYGQSQFYNMTTVPTMPANNPYQINHNNNKFAMNGHINPMPIGGHLTQQQQQQYQQQQLHLNQQQKQQQHQRINVNLNANVNVLRSQLNMAPSISLIPDLGFAAPKSLVNLSRTNASNKK